MHARWLSALALLGLMAGAASVGAQTTTLPPGTTADPVAPAPQIAAPLALKPAGGLADAETKLDTKDFVDARSLLDAYVSAHPTDARGLFDLGYAEDALGDAADAEASYRKAIAANPKQLESHVALGLLLASQGKQAVAVAELSTASRLKPNPPNPAAQAQANRALARLQETSNPEAASEALIAALQESPETTADTLLAAEIAGREGNADIAAAAYGKVLAGAPAGSAERAEASAGLAHLLIAAKRYSEAEPVLRKALAATPESPALNAQLAEVLSAEGKETEAVSVAEKLHGLQPDDLGVASMLADMYTQTGAWDKADPIYRQLLAAHPNDPALLAARGDMLIRSGHSVEALPVLQEATRLNPANGDAWGSLAFAADQAHQPQLVLDAIAMRSKVMPETPATYFLAATACDTLHQTKRAEALYRQFLSVAGTSYPDETWQARHRLVALAK